MSLLNQIEQELSARPGTWVITGVAGFIGSHLLYGLLRLNQRVRGIDNFFTGRKLNLEQVKQQLSGQQWANFEFHEGDVRDGLACRDLCAGAQYVLHHAALGSVPLSIEDPLQANSVNVDGTLQMLQAAREAKVRRFVYASSSAVYGDQPDSLAREERIGQALSPYAASKHINELYAGVFGRCYGMESIGLRYFNVFGPRQDPAGAYAAVIPKWVSALLRNEPVYINGDGETTRDFCHVDNVVQANLLAALTTNPEAVNQVYNIAVNQRTSLNQLFATLRELLSRRQPALKTGPPVYRDFRPGDVRHSQADITRARRLLAYEPTVQLRDGLEASLDWYEKHLG